MAKTKQQDPHTDLASSHEHAQDELLECVEECLNCHAVCTMTLQHCMAKGGDLTELNLVGLLLDCAEICQTSANFMLRGSPYHVVTCGACAELCRACATACSAVAGDEQMTHCAEVCEECAESCGRMSQLDDVDEA
jgi:hypothetical protein